MPLAEDKRSQLDSIVQQMQSAGEEESSIQAVVEDFKSKYSTPEPIAAPQASSQDRPRQGLGGVVEGVAGRVVDTAKGLGDVALKTVSPLYNLYKAPEILAGMQETANKSLDYLGEAKEDISEGSLGRAAGNAALAGLNAFPLTSGSVGAGEKIASGDSRGYGEAAFDLGTAIIPEAAVRIPSIPGASKLGSNLRKGAAKQWGEGLWPKLKYEGLAEKVGAQALEKGLWGSQDSLAAAAEKNLAMRGPQIEDLIKGSSKRVNPKAYSLEALEELANSEKTGGVEQGIRSLEEAAQMELARLPEDISLSEAWEMRKIKEDPMVRKSAYLPGADPQLTARVEAQGLVADKTRNALVEAEPSLQKPMQEYNFYKNLETLLSPKSMKKTPNTALNPFKARTVLDLVDPYRIVQSIRNSTRFKTGSALLKDKIGKYLESGNIPEAAKLAQVELPEELKAPEVWNGIERPINEMQASRGQSSVVLDRARAEGLPEVFEGEISPSAYSGGIPDPFQPKGNMPDVWTGLDQAELPNFRQDNLELPIEQKPYLGPDSYAPRVPRNWGDQIPEGFGEIIPEQSRIPEPRYPQFPERAQTLEEAAFTRAESPEVDWRSGPTPELAQEQPLNQFGFLDEVQDSLPGLSVEPDVAQTVMAELEQVGYQPEAIPLDKLGPNKIKALELADKKSIEAIMRTIKNPTYQSLPVQALKAGQKTKASVIREIFLRNRKLALGKKAIQTLEAKPLESSGATVVNAELIDKPIHTIDVSPRLRKELFSAYGEDIGKAPLRRYPVMGISDETWTKYTKDPSTPLNEEIVSYIEGPATNSQGALAGLIYGKLKKLIQSGELKVPGKKKASERDFSIDWGEND